MTEFLFKELTRQIIGIYFDVYNGTGRTYPEFVYEKAMWQDFRQQSIRCERQEEYQIFYKGRPVGRQRLDMFIAREVIVEIKVASGLTPLHKAQTISYLKTFGKQVGLLCNFGGPKPEFERLFFQANQVQTAPDIMPHPSGDWPADLIAPEVIYNIIGGLYTVHSILGPGFIYRIYANACCCELQERGLPVQPHKEIQVFYRGQPIAAVKFAHLRVGHAALVFPVAVNDLNNISFNNIKDWLRAQQIPYGYFG